MRDVLRGITDPCSVAAGVPISVLDMGIIRTIEAGPDHVRVVLRPTNPVCLQIGAIAEAITRDIQQSLEVRVEIQVDPTDDWEPEMIASEAQVRLRALRPLPMPKARQPPQQPDGG